MLQCQSTVLDGGGERNVYGGAPISSVQQEARVDLVAAGRQQIDGSRQQAEPAGVVDAAQIVITNGETT